MDATTICNYALARLGQSQIMSMEDASKPARFCKRMYPQTRDEVLRSHPWNFAGKRATLAMLLDKPEFEWLYQYQLPTDFLRMLELNSYRTGESLKLFEIEGDRLLTNESQAQVKYVWRLVDANKFDPLFVEALSVKLASKLAKPLTGSASMATDLLTEYERITAPLARIVDAKEKRRRYRLPQLDSLLIRSRYGGIY